jgi:competence protein ComEA
VSDAIPPPEATSGPHRPPAPLSWRERLGRLGDPIGIEITPIRVVLAVLGVGAAAVVWLVLLRPPAATTPEAHLPFAETSTPSGDTTSSVPATVLAHAAGAVVAPGVYDVPAGGRVADLVAAAGGATTDADLNRVNLAAPLEDGQQVYVPRIGEVVAGSQTEPAVEPGSGASGPSGEQIDINTAPVDRLEELPGIGPALAQAIITYREEHGAFTSVDELLEVPGIGEAKLAQLRELVTV